MTIIPDDNVVQLNLTGFPTADHGVFSVQKEHWSDVEVAVRKHKEVKQVYVDSEGFLCVTVKLETMLNLTDDKRESTLRSIERWIIQTATKIAASRMAAVSS